MKYLVKIAVVFICALVHIHAQQDKLFLKEFSQTNLQDGVHSFDIMKYVNTDLEDDIFEYESGKLNSRKFKFDSVLTKEALKFKSVGQIKLRIENFDTIISIQPDGNSFFPNVEINLYSSTVSINGKVLEFMERTQVENELNAFESNWSGYEWRSSRSTLSQHKFTLGLIEKTKRLYIEIKWFENNQKFHYRIFG